MARVGLAIRIICATINQFFLNDIWIAELDPNLQCSRRVKFSAKRSLEKTDALLFMPGALQVRSSIVRPQSALCIRSAWSNAIGQTDDSKYCRPIRATALILARKKFDRQRAIVDPFDKLTDT